jgi:hypothetical protein
MGQYTISLNPRHGAERNLRRRLWETQQQSAPVTEDSCASPPPKRPKVTVEEVPDPDVPSRTLEGPHSCDSTGQEPRESLSTASRDRVRPQHMYRYKGLYAEDFPDLLAGSPVSSTHACPPNLAEYMRTCGPMVNPDHFKTAELLMTSGLSNTDKDRHLKSKKVSNA